MRIIIFYASGANENFHKILVMIPNGEKPHKRHRFKWEYNINIDI
jgi:hypothetical protein